MKGSKPSVRADHRIEDEGANRSIAGRRGSRHTALKHSIVIRYSDSAIYRVKFEFGGALDHDDTGGQDGERTYALSRWAFSRCSSASHLREVRN
jgi:hypothetical protein